MVNGHAQGVMCHTLGKSSATSVILTQDLHIAVISKKLHLIIQVPDLSSVYLQSSSFTHVFISARRRARP